ncbi:hypothetical protein A9Q79_02345 [Methylophaga sp. 42_25_T18]|nr:hypothetical protein A9Q79_02345 [Methylophaga sp. 42_25_T18]
MRLHFLFGLFIFFGSTTILAADTITLSSETGDTLMIHQLKNGELWGSFMLTDKVSDSFADHELIVLQIDKQQPVKLEGKRSCGGAAGEKQTVSYDFLADENSTDVNWQFSHSEVAEQDIFVLLGEDAETYQTLSSDRRPEVVDFPIRASVGLASLLTQMKQGKMISFRYTTEADEQREAKFDLVANSEQLAKVLK